ncbi:uncharacterized protein LOC120474087 isoform X4 [Pimephales promelas]|uniref:uncharacterized protein LOC120474087 isoform X4 n=1 Tax=Pimephales promelas TaxID=90988 RepID=UPI001955BA5D|nr:uncharacterized protein LOC120474087 isoform X4 [Pimephales promelas]
MGRRCCVAGCNSTAGLHNFPADLNIRRRWLYALGMQDREFPSIARVCNLHFTRDCFSNAMEVEMGFSTQLALRSDAVPNAHPPRPPPPRTAPARRRLKPSPSVGFAHVACQTDPPTAPSCGSPLSKKTHTPPFRSTGGAVSCPDAGVDTAAVSASGPSRKRPRLDEEELNEGPRDVTNAPLHSLTATQSTDVKTDPSSRPTRCPSTSCMRAVSWSCSRCA